MYAYQAVYILIVNLFLSADTQIQRKLLYLSVCGFLFLETASFLLIVSRIHIFGVIKKRKENINNGKTEITKMRSREDSSGKSYFERKQTCFC